MDIEDRLSRIIPIACNTRDFNRSWGYKKSTKHRLIGRLVLNIWRLCRNEISSLRSYDFENVCLQLFKEKYHLFNPHLLANWFAQDATRWKSLLYMNERLLAYCSILQKLGIMSKTIEAAKLYGVLFAEVQNRGSQFKVPNFFFLRLNR